MSRFFCGQKGGVLGEVLEFGKTPIGEIIKSLKLAKNLGLWVEVNANKGLGWGTRQMPVALLLLEIKVILTYKKGCQRPFSLKTFQGTKISWLSLIESIDLEAQVLCFKERGNQYYFEGVFGEIKVQEC